MTMIDSLPDAVLRTITDLSTATADRFRNAILPIYASAHGGTPVHVGTAMALDWRRQKLLLTAAHVIDNNESVSLYVGGPNLTLLEMEFFTSSKSGQDRRHDHYDFAIGPIPRQTLGALEGVSFFLESDVCTANSEPEGTTYTVVGYPNSMNKKMNATKRVVYANLFHYSDIARTNQPVAKRLNISDATHTFMHYDQRRSQDTQGQHVNSIQLKGMSGGPVFNIGVLSDPSVLSGSRHPSPCLIGLFTEYHQDEQTIIATRIQTILGAVSHRFPE